jgi:hypothetical protein
MKIPILNGNGYRKKKRDLIYAVRDAIRSEYMDRKAPKFSFKLDNYIWRGGRVKVTEYNEVDGKEVTKKVRSKRHESPLVVGCLNVENQNGQFEHILSLETLKQKFENDPDYNAVNISLIDYGYKILAYRIGVELERKHYNTGFTIEKKIEKKPSVPNMSLSKFREIFEKI